MLKEVGEKSEKYKRYMGLKEKYGDIIEYCFILDKDN